MNVSRCLSGGLIAIAAMGGGCAVGPRYEAPKKSVAVAFAEAAHEADAAGGRIRAGEEPMARWWTTFNDPELDSLIRRAIAGNKNLKVAVSRVRQARIQRAIAAAGLWPSVDLKGGYNRGHGSENVELPFGNTAPASTSGPPATTRAIRSEELAPNTPPAVNPSAGAGGNSRPSGPTSPLGEGGLPGVTTNIYQIGFDASWELDLFGGLQRSIEAAEAATQAAEEGARGALISLLGEVAQTYIQLRLVQHRLDLARQNISVVRDTLNIEQAKFRNGLATDLEVARQRAELAGLSAAVPTLEASERVTVHALSVLTGEEPDALAGELAGTGNLPAIPGDIPIGLPSDLLRRRPDIRQAEREVAGATARIGVAMSDLFPHFNLAAQFGLDSSQPRDLGKWSSHYYSITPGIRWPLLDWGKTRLNVGLAGEMKNEALAQYEVVVEQAMLEVENALVLFRGEREARTARADALAASREAFDLARQRYDHGLIDSLQVLEAQRSLISSEDALAQSDGEMRKDLVALYKALGGGWENESQ